MDREVTLPERYQINGKVLDNPIRQLAVPKSTQTYSLVNLQVGRSSLPALDLPDGSRIVLAQRRSQASDEITNLFLTEEGDQVRNNFTSAINGKWALPESKLPGDLSVQDMEITATNVVESWRGRFQIVEELRNPDNSVNKGLRPPQIGAVYSVLAHWKITEEPATVVLPTGTGKTETMLALMCAVRAKKVLVVVPTNNLREQIGEKFITLGHLPGLGALSPGFQYPIVCQLKHKPKSSAEVDEIFGRCNVIVTTMSIAGQCQPEVQRRMAELASHVFIDEAHHVSATTWSAFRDVVRSRPIIQFTATPFRNDGKHVDGKVVFNYPLRKAQSDNYFQPIQFLPVNELDPEDADKAIAAKAVEQLKADLRYGRDHLVMARCEFIRRAEAVHAVYRQAAPEYSPVLIHTELTGAEAEEALQAMRERRSRIIVCVDMLGEGFDLPELKVAAIHDAHRSLAITLQFTGRFTRPRADLGSATVIANIADPQMESSLQNLYAEDADWNSLLRVLSEQENVRHAERSEFIEGFRDLPTTVALQNIFPKMSAVVYRTRCANWSPEMATDAVLGGEVVEIYAGPAINPDKAVVLFVTKELDAVPWGDIKDVRNTVWHLYLLHWDRNASLLYINSSNNTSLHEGLAEAVCGSEVDLIKGETIFRSLHNVQRLVLNNLGLSDVINLRLRHSQHMGLDISEALPDALRQNKKKTNLFGRGFENGRPVNIGCSMKGRVWSMAVADDMSEWITWCHAMGAKLVDDNISTADVFKNVILPESLTVRPNQVPILIEWPSLFLETSEDKITVSLDGRTALFFDAELRVTTPSTTGPIGFKIVLVDREAHYEMTLDATGARFRPSGAVGATIKIGKTERPLEQWFANDPPVVRFASGAFLEGSDFYKVEPQGARSPYDPARLVAWDWAGVDISIESQTIAKIQNSIQRRVINELLAEAQPFDVIFDDDASGEAADVVCLAIRGNRLVVHMYHCKYISKESGIAGVGELYEVCGQAQRAARWRNSVPELIRHLRSREHTRKRRMARVGESFVTRFEKGNETVLKSIASRAQMLIPEFRMFIVQPGLSRAALDEKHLDLLAATELYLMETAAIPLEVVGKE